MRQYGRSGTIERRGRSSACAAAARRKVNRPGAPRPLSSYGLFLKLTKSNPALNKLPIRQRGRALGKLWQLVPPQQKKALAAKARTILVPRKAPKVRKPRKPSAYNRFVQANYGKVRKLHYLKRLKVLEQMGSWI